VLLCHRFSQEAYRPRTSHTVDQLKTKLRRTEEFGKDLHDRYQRTAANVLKLEKDLETANENLERAEERNESLNRSIEAGNQTIKDLRVVIERLKTNLHTLASTIDTIAQR